MTTTERLEQLLAIKADIKSALTEKGLTTTEVFNTYADQIRSLGVTATDDGNGNVAIKMVGASVTATNGDVTIE